MNNFFKDTTTDQHHHEQEHGTAGSDADPDNRNNSISESPNDAEKHNQQHKGKESEDMKRTAQNTSAPIFTGLALSVMVILFSALDSNGFANVFVAELPEKACAAFNFNAGKWSYSDASNSFNANSFNRSDDFGADGRIFPRADENAFTGFRADGFISPGDFYVDWFNSDRITNANAKLFNQDGRNYYRVVDTGSALFCDKQTFDFGNEFPDVSKEFRIPRVVSTPFYGFTSAGFSA
jgi:hypothetical protein